MKNKEKWYNDPIYQNMCEKAIEIQKLWKPSVGDICRSTDNFLHILTLQTFHDMNRKRCFDWLPTQSQLQGMVGIVEKFKDCLSLFISWLRDCGQTEPYYEVQTKFHSMEQLWLAFVMKEKYNKTWNGEDWVL